MSPIHSKKIKVPVAMFEALMTLAGKAVDSEFDSYLQAGEARPKSVRDAMKLVTRARGYITRYKEKRSSYESACPKE